MDVIYQKHLKLLDQIQAYQNIINPNNIEAQNILSHFHKELSLIINELKPAEFIESPLSKREHDVLVLIAQGQPNKEIAYRLDISPKTVQFHIKNIFIKLNVGSRTEAATEALKKGYLAKN